MPLPPWSLVTSLRCNATARKARREIASVIGTWIALAAVLISTDTTISAQETRWPDCAPAGLASLVVRTAPSDPPENQV